MTKEEILWNINQLNNMVSTMENFFQDEPLTKGIVQNLKTIKSRRRLIYYKQFRKFRRNHVTEYCKKKGIEILSLQLSITDELEISYLIKTKDGEQFITEETLTQELK